MVSENYERGGGGKKDGIGRLSFERHITALFHDLRHRAYLNLRKKKSNGG